MDHTDVPLPDKKKCATCEHGRTEICSAESICLSASAWEPREEYVVKTCDDCKYGDDECFEVVGMCDDYDKWESAKKSEPGGSTPEQYSIPKDAEELQDLIEHRKMNFSMGNIFKACYRFGTCSHSDELRDINKIIWFANREKKRILQNEG